jgi:hypothetical protein
MWSYLLLSLVAYFFLMYLLFLYIFFLSHYVLNAVLTHLSVSAFNFHLSILPPWVYFLPYICVQTVGTVNFLFLVIVYACDFLKQHLPHLAATFLLLTVVGLLCIELLSYVYFCSLMCIVLLCVCIAVLHTVVAGLLARSQYPEGPATGHLGTGFSWFPSV